MELCGEVATRAQSSGVSPFGSDPAQWSPCSSLPEYGNVVAVMDTWLNTGACRGSWFFWVQLFSLRTSALYFLSYLHQNPSTVYDFILVFLSQAQLHQWLCLLSHLLVSAALLFENQCAFLFERHYKNRWKLDRGRSLLEVEQPVAGAWLLPVPNANLCPFW